MKELTIKQIADEKLKYYKMLSIIYFVATLPLFFIVVKFLMYSFYLFLMLPVICLYLGITTFKELKRLNRLFNDPDFEEYKDFRVVKLKVKERYVGMRGGHVKFENDTKYTYSYIEEDFFKRGTLHYVIVENNSGEILYVAPMDKYKLNLELERMISDK